MISVINTENLGISEYDISNIIDIVSASGVTYFVGSSGVYYFDDSLSESVTSTVETGYVSLGDSSPKRVPHLEVTSDIPCTGRSVFSGINSIDIEGIEDCRHENVSSYKLAGGLKGTHFRFKITHEGQEDFNILGLQILPIDTLVKK
jgi:hypothetical protein